MVTDFGVSCLTSNLPRAIGNPALENQFKFANLTIHILFWGIINTNLLLFSG